MTFETFDQNDERTWPDQKKTMKKDKYTDKDNPRDLWHLRHWLQFWQLRTWIHDIVCCLTIKSGTGQHSQFLRCLLQQQANAVFTHYHILQMALPQIWYPPKCTKSKSHEVQNWLSGSQGGQVISFANVTEWLYLFIQKIYSYMWEMYFFVNGRNCIMLKLWIMHFLSLSNSAIFE